MPPSSTAVPDKLRLDLLPHQRVLTVEGAPSRAAAERARTSSHPGAIQPGSAARDILLLLAVWIAVFFSAVGTPSLLDDADATHAEAAQAMLRTGDWVTLHVNGIRYLEKPPLPYWMAAISLRVFGQNSFAIHLPLALTVLGLALLGWLWGRRAFSAGGSFSTRDTFSYPGIINDRAGLYAGLFTLTSAGVFLFTRIFIPDALLSLLLATCLYAALRALDPDNLRSALHAHLLWAALAGAVLTKGLVAVVFLSGALLPFLLLTGDWRQWRRLRPITGSLLFLALAAPWHILAALRNPPVPLPPHLGFPAHAGWTWFYLYNEHVARFLGQRIPHDYNKLPFALYWSLHIVWLFPWSLFAPAAAILAWRQRHRLRLSALPTLDFGRRTILLLGIFSSLILVFFSVSTNQEYYTLPVYLPLLLLTAGALAHIEYSAAPLAIRRALSFAHAAFTVLGLAVASALGYGLWTSRHLAFVPDIGALLAHRGVGDYTLSMSHFFDLTGPSFAALRLPAALAAVAFAIGPLTAWILRRRDHALASTLTVAATAAVFLVAAHIALIRFAPMLSSHDFAARIDTLEHTGSIGPNTEVMLYGDQAYGSSIPFYLDRTVQLVDGRSTSMLFGSLFPDAPHIFLSGNDLLAQWGHGPRKILFVPLEKRDAVDQLLGHRQILLQETSGKALITDRPLNPLR